MPKTGTYHYKCTVAGSGWKASPMGDMAEGMPDCEGPTMYELEKAMMDACNEASGMPGFNYACDFVTPKVALFTACIGTAKAGVMVGGGGGGAPAAAAAAPAAGAAAAKAPEPEPEEEEEDMGFDLFD